MGIFVGWGLVTVKAEYGIYNVVIIRTVAVFASILTGFLIAFPMGYIGAIRTRYYGYAMPAVGFILMFVTSLQDGLQLIINAYFEWTALIVSCGIFWHLGYLMKSRKAEARPETASYS